MATDETTADQPVKRIKPHHLVIGLGVAAHGARDVWGLTHICLQALVLLGLMAALGPEALRHEIVDGFTGLGAGAGNTPMEVLVAVLDRMGPSLGVTTGVDVWTAVAAPVAGMAAFTAVVGAVAGAEKDDGDL